MSLDPNKLAQSLPPAESAASPNFASQAVIAVTSTPSGAEISVDGNFAGSTPSSVAVRMGSHTISVYKSGYASWERTIRVRGGTVNLAVELSHSLRAQAGGGR